MTRLGPAGATLVVAMLAAGARALSAQPPPPPIAEPPVQAPAQVGSPATLPETAPVPSAPDQKASVAATPATTTPAPTAPSTAPTAPAAAPLEDRIAFEFKVPPAKGGGTVSGTAKSVETSGESEATLSGEVEIKYRNLTFKAERVVLHRDTMTVEAEGDVILDQTSRRVAAQRADFDLATETGTFWKASAFAEPDQYFTGEVLTKTGEQTFEIEDGVVTSCTGDPTPDWSFRISKAKVEVGGYAHLTNARMRMKKLPFFYWPYMIWPAKTERSSGFLIPNIGYTNQRGAVLGLAYFQVLGPSADVTLHVDGYEKQYLGAGLELRYAPVEGTKGNLVYQALSDRDVSQTETRTIWQHTTERLPGGFRAVVDVNQYSNYDFFREFQRGERENTRSFLYSNAFLSGNWGAQSLSMVVDQRETFRTGLESTMQRQLPEIAYRLRKLKLGVMPLYLSLESTASYFQSENPGVFDVTYGRFDLAPELTLPLKVAPWMSVALSAGGRGTWWGESVPVTEIDPETGLSRRLCDGVEVPVEQTYCGEQLTRVVPEGRLEMVGPSFSRIFDSPGGRFDKFKHLIEPRMQYGYAAEYDDQDRVARFDEIDGVSSANSGRFALVNRVLAKPTDPEEGGAFEIFSFELAQNYSFDDRTLQRSKDGTLTSKEGPIQASLRYSPTRTFDLQSKVLWSTLFNSLDSTSLSARGKGKRVGFDVTWYSNYDAETSTRQSDQARVGFDLAIVPERLSLAGQVNYDIEKGELQQHRYFVNYRSQCWSLLVEYREQLTSTYESQDYRFLLSLKNVGTFLDLHGGESTSSY